ncbi:hypothetical protein A616_06475 [Brevibacillus brevis X23]|nr:hypothetical protein A616_06475 [Brevibacillus brevis X23]
MNNNLYDYHKHNLVYIGDYIKFADQKAGVGLTLNLAILGYFITYLKTANFSMFVVNKVFLIIGVALLLVSSFLFFSVIWPRYVGDTRYYMSWGGIGAFKSANEYQLLLKEKTEEQFLDDMATQNHSLAKVCKNKYSFLRWGIMVLIIGIVTTGVSWFFDK